MVIFMMSYGYIWTQLISVFAMAKRKLQFNVRRLLDVCVFGIHKYLSLIDFRTLSEYVQILDYIKCMTLTQNVDPNVYRSLSDDNNNKIKKYINDRIIM